MTPNKNPSKTSTSIPKKGDISGQNTPVSTQKSLKYSKKQTNTNPTQENYSQVSSRLYQNTKSIDNKRNLKYKSQSAYNEVHTPSKNIRKEFFVSKPKKPLMRPDNNYEPGQCEVKRLTRTPTKNSQRYVPSTRN
jgi:hypothetical protein